MYGKLSGDELAKSVKLIGSRLERGEKGKEQKWKFVTGSKKITALGRA